MPEIKAAWFALLSEIEALAPLVATRIYPEVVPQEAMLPYVTYTVLGGTSPQYFRGVSALGETRIQTNIWALTARSRTEITEVIRTALDGRYGLKSAGLSVRRITLTDSLESFLVPDDGSEIGTFATDLTFTVWHRR